MLPNVALRQNLSSGQHDEAPIWSGDNAVSNGKNKTGSELFIVDNSDRNWKVLNYLHDWCQLSKNIDIATGFFEIGSLLALKDEWQKVDRIRILMGDEVSKRTKQAFIEGLGRITGRLNDSIESEKEKNDFLKGVPAIVEAIRSGKMICRLYRKNKFHAKAYITHARQEVIGAFALVGSSNFTYPGLAENVEMNVQIAGRQVNALQEWYERYWAEAEDVTADILKTIERHTRDYTPFEVYARSLQAYFRNHEMTADEWEKNQSKIYPILATYQKHGYHGLMKRSQKYNGAFLCDGVGLGKTYIGLMLIERLVIRENKRVVLFVPKAAREAVWESKIRKHIPDILDGFLSFRIYNHTDLLRKNCNIRQKLLQMQKQADVVIIDEAHHFRNTGIRGEEDGERKSRYWEMFDLCEGKQLYMLTATPVNNRLTDLQHMTELFSRRQTDYFKTAPLGIHSLPGHIRKLEKAIEAAIVGKEKPENGDVVYETNLAEAEDVLRDDSLFEELVVQRSRAYVKKSLAEEDGEVLFPEPSVPRVVPYSVKQTYGKLLKMVEDAFHKDKPLFSLAMYYPWEYYIPDEKPDAMVEGRQKQVVSLIRTSFLKRFESSVYAFTSSCQILMKKLVAFYQVHAEDKRDRDRLEKWLMRNKIITGYDPHKQLTLFPDQIDLELAEDDIIEPEFFEKAYENKLDANEFEISGLLADTINDLDTIAEFLKELSKFQPKQDKKLRALINLLKNDSVLQKHKCLIFSEFKDTARYLAEQLGEADIDGVIEIDSAISTNGRLELIQRFAPYYNDLSSGKLAEKKLDETRIMISTDVLSEGLNLQDATRLINYDLHWNPVRLMQRIGRIDRRLDPETEAQIIADHPDQERLRGTIQYYNFLPPEELNELLTLYKKVTHKTLRISKTFGIENGKLLRPDDNFDVLRDFVRLCEGHESQSENMSLEFQRLLKENPDLEEKLNNFPNRIFSGKEHPGTDSRAVFFCYALPATQAVSRWEGELFETAQWTEQAGYTTWYMYDLVTEDILTEPGEIVQAIRSTPDTPRHCRIEQQTLSEIREKIEKHIKNTYLKKVQAPVGIKPILKAWMELN